MSVLYGSGAASPACVAELECLVFGSFEQGHLKTRHQFNFFHQLFWITGCLHLNVKDETAINNLFSPQMLAFIVGLLFVNIQPPQRKTGPGCEGVLELWRKSHLSS